MKVTVKVPMNDSLIAEITKKNKENDQQRTFNEANKADKQFTMILVPDNKPIPERLIEDKPMEIDPYYVEMLTISGNGMIQIIYETPKNNLQFEFVFDQEVYDEIERTMREKIFKKRADLKQNL